MSFAPSTTPAGQRVTVGTSAVSVTVPVTPGSNNPKLGVILLQRAGDTGNVFRGWDSGVTTSTGLLVAKGNPGSTGPTIIPEEAFDGTHILYLIADTAGQLVDVEII